MNDFDILKVNGPDGNEIEIKVITMLKKPNSDYNFILYTFDDTEDDIDIYASIIKEENNTYILDSIQNEEDWNLVQKAIKELAE